MPSLYLLNINALRSMLHDRLAELWSRPLQPSNEVPLRIRYESSDYLLHTHFYVAIRIMVEVSIEVHVSPPDLGSPSECVFLSFFVFYFVISESLNHMHRDSLHRLDV